MCLTINLNSDESVCVCVCGGVGVGVIEPHKQACPTSLLPLFTKKGGRGKIMIQNKEKKIILLPCSESKRLYNRVEQGRQLSYISV